MHIHAVRTDASLIFHKHQHKLGWVAGDPVLKLLQNLDPVRLLVELPVKDPEFLRGTRLVFDTNIECTNACIQLLRERQILGFGVIEGVRNLPDLGIQIAVKSHRVMGRGNPHRGYGCVVRNPKRAHPVAHICLHPARVVLRAACTNDQLTIVQPCRVPAARCTACAGVEHALLRAVRYADAARIGRTRLAHDT